MQHCDSLLNGSGGIGGLVAHLHPFCGRLNIISLVVPAETVHPVEAELLVGEAKIAHAGIRPPTSRPGVDDGVADAAVL